MGMANADDGSVVSLFISNPGFNLFLVVRSAVKPAVRP